MSLDVIKERELTMRVSLHMSVSTGSRVWQWDGHSPSAGPVVLSFFVGMGEAWREPRGAASACCGKDDKLLQISPSPLPLVLGRIQPNATSVINAIRYPRLGVEQAS